MVKQSRLMAFIHHLSSIHLSLSFTIDPNPSTIYHIHRPSIIPIDPSIILIDPSIIPIDPSIIYSIVSVVQVGCGMTSTMKDLQLHNGNFTPVMYHVNCLC